MDGDGDGVGDIEVDGEGDGVDPVGVGSAPHDTPLKLNAPGTALVPEYVPWNPKLAVPPVASAPLYPTDAAVTAAPDWVTVAFHPDVTRWSPANVHDSVHEVTAAPVLVTLTSAVKPLDHWLTV